MGNRWPRLAYRLSLQKPAFIERASSFLGPYPMPFLPAAVEDFAGESA